MCTVHGLGAHFTFLANQRSHAKCTRSWRHKRVAAANGVQLRATLKAPWALHSPLFVHRSMQLGHRIALF